MNFTAIPFDKIIRFGQQTMLDRPLFSVSWILGRFCNYKCSYCWPYARSDQLDYQSLDAYKHTVDEIKRQARNNGFNQFHWSFTKWWNSWCKNTEMLQRRSITASFHDEFAKEQEFGDKCLQLQYELVFVTVNQVMVPEKFYELYARMERLHARGINVTLKPMSDPTASKIVDGYTEDMIHKMRTGFPQTAQGEELFQIRLNDGKKDYYFDQAERFNAFGFNKFKEWSCNSGYQSVIIRGTEVKRSYSCHDQALGTLDNFELFKEPKRCITPTCVSSADSKIPKCK